MPLTQLPNKNVKFLYVYYDTSYPWLQAGIQQFTVAGNALI